ncbi:hypothetical protein GCM10011414_13170 [Croceivirga lutea]|nr:hypothetical protein GCM10011414_13170 [Croceivirga lutea]
MGRTVANKGIYTIVKFNFSSLEILKNSYDFQHRLLYYVNQKSFVEDTINITSLISFK